MPAPVNPNASQLDQTQILQRAFDESTDKLRVDSSVSITEIQGEVAVEIDAADGDNIALSNADGSKKVTVSTVGSLNGLDSKIINSSGSDAVNIQDGGNSITIDTPQLASTLGQKTMANSAAVVIASDQTVIPVSDNAGSLTIDTPQLASTLGQKVMASSAAVVIASDQSVIPVSDNAGSLTVDTPQLASTLGQKTMANSAAVVLASDQSAIPVSQSGTWTVQQGTPPWSIKYADTANLDSFGRLRVSNPVSIFESTFEYDIQPLVWTSSLVGSGTVTHNLNRSSIALNTTTASGDSAVYQTRHYLSYHPGKSQVVVISGNLNSLQTNSRKRIGQFDANNGFYFEADGTTLYVVVRSSVSGVVVNTRVAQTDWNIDKLNGTGASGITLDPTLQQILFIDYQWLGSGRIRFGCVINGQIIYAHQFTFSNISTTPYSRTGTLPIRAELTNTGVTSASSTSYITCCTVYSEGEFAPEGIARTINNGVAVKTIAAVGNIPILTIRKSAAGINIPVRLNGISIFCSTTDDLLITLTVNATLTAPTFTLTSGFVQGDVGATAMTGGTEVYSFFIKGTGAGFAQQVEEDFFRLNNLILGASLAGVSDTITISAASFTGVANVSAIFNFQELY